MRTFRKEQFSAVCAVILLMMQASSLADGITYTSVANGDWNVAGTWDQGSGYPDSNDTAIVTNTVKVPSGFTVSEYATVEVRTNGVINNYHGTVAAPLAMKGGSLFSEDSYYNGIITLQTDAYFRTAWDFRIKGGISGPYKVQFYDTGQGGKYRGFYFFVSSPSWSGGAELLNGETYLHNSVVNGIGTGPVTINTNAWLYLEGEGNNPVPGGIILNGGAVRGNGQSGTLGYSDATIVLVADSSAGDWTWQDFSFNGYISGNYTLALYGPGYTAWLNNPTNSFKDLKVSGTDCRLKVPGSQGTGTVTVTSGSVLKLDANPNQDWVMTNGLAGVGKFDVEGGAKKLYARGRTITPGITNTVGTLTINGSIDMDSSSTLLIQIAGIASNSILAVTGTVTLADLDLDVALSGGFEPAPEQSFTILDNDGADAVAGIFANESAPGSVTFTNGWKCHVSYAGGDGNDIVLNTFTRTSQGTILIVR